jgi:PIN domain nuclease of toxin-antitoxin system
MRRLLLDTHVFLWWLAHDPRLGAQAKVAIADTANPVFISAASGSEIAMKRQLGKLSAPDNLDAAVEAEGFAHLPITFFHAEQAGLLPGDPSDPFDRMLVAQARAEGLLIVTADPNIARYGIRTLSAEE